MKFICIILYVIICHKNTKLCCGCSDRNAVSRSSVLLFAGFPFRKHSASLQIESDWYCFNQRPRWTLAAFSSLASIYQPRPSRQWRTPLFPVPNVHVVHVVQCCAMLCNVVQCCACWIILELYQYQIDPNCNDTCSAYQCIQFYKIYKVLHHTVILYLESAQCIWSCHRQHVLQ